MQSHMKEKLKWNLILTPKWTDVPQKGICPSDTLN